MTYHQQHTERTVDRKAPPARKGDQGRTFEVTEGERDAPLKFSVTAYHGTPFTPRRVLNEALEKNAHCFLVNHFTPTDDQWCDENSKEWVGDNGVFPLWQAAKRKALMAGERFEGVVYTQERYDAYVSWCRRWCLEGSGRCKWVAIPDPIGTSTQELDAFLRMWPADLKDYGVPVYHLDEPIDRAVMLLRNFGRLCVGATGEYEIIPSAAFRERMDDLFCAIWGAFGRIPPIHMFRGLQLLKPEFDWQITSADSTNEARNHNQLKWRKNPIRLGRFLPPEAPLFDDLPAYRGERVSDDEYLWKVRQRFLGWDRMASARKPSWPPQRITEARIAA